MRNTLSYIFTKLLTAHFHSIFYRLYIVVLLTFSFSLNAYSRYTQPVVLGVSWTEQGVYHVGLVVVSPFLQGKYLSGELKVYFFDSSSGPVWLSQDVRYEAGDDNVFYIKGGNIVASNSRRYKTITLMMYRNGKMLKMYNDGSMSVVVGKWYNVPPDEWKDAFQKFGIKNTRLLN